MGMTQTRGQDFAVDLEKMYCAISDHSSFQAEVVVSSYTLIDADVDKYQISIHRDKDRYKTILDDMIVLGNTDEVLMIDLKDQVMILRSNLDKSKNREGALINQDLKEILEDTEWDISLLDTNSEEHIYRLTKEGHETYSEVFIGFDQRTHFLSRMEYVYAKDEDDTVARVYAEYRNVRFDPVFDPDFFSIAQAVKKDKSDLIPAGVYKDFELIDLSSFEN